jgi:hypothetical protein
VAKRSAKGVDSTKWNTLCLVWDHDVGPIHFKGLTRLRGNGITRNMRKVLRASHGRKRTAVHQTR